MGDRPPSGGKKFICGWLKPFQVPDVFTTGSHVGSCIQFEADLISTTRNMKNKRAVGSGLRTLLKAVWQAEVEQRCRTRIEPILCEPEGSGDIGCRLGKRRWKAVQPHVTLILHDCDDVEVPGRAHPQAEKQEPTAPDRHQLVSVAAGF